MAKLIHLTEWMTRALNGDGARARSLVQIARKNGALTTGGRGRGAPDVGNHDAATAALLVLMDAPPTQCVEELNKLKSMKVGNLEIFPNGPRCEREIFDHYDEENRKLVPLPSQYDVFPNTPMDALIKIFDAPERPYWLDEISLETSSRIKELSISLYDLNRETNTDLESERDFFFFTLKFFDVTFAEPDFTDNKFCTGIEVNRVLTGGSLVDLYYLINDRPFDEDDDEIVAAALAGEG